MAKPTYSAEDKAAFARKDASIVAQTAVKAASELTSAFITAGVITTEEEGLARFNGLVTEIEGRVAQSVDAAAEAPSQAESNVQAAFPGATEAPKAAPKQGEFPPDGDTVVKFGKYGGKSLRAIHAEDPEYVDFLAEKSNNEFIKKKARFFLRSLAS